MCIIIIEEGGGYMIPRAWMPSRLNLEVQLSNPTNFWNATIHGFLVKPAIILYIRFMKHMSEARG